MGRRQEIDGRQLLLAAALKLFAEQGVEGVSIRAVTREAGLGPASVHYHFGTREGLVEAVLSAQGDDVAAAVAAGAKTLIASDGPATARELVMVLAQPYFDLIATHGGSGVAWVRRVSHLLQTDPDRITHKPTSRLMGSAAARLYPDASPAMVQRAMRMCFQLLVTQLAQVGTSRGAARPSLDYDLLIDFLSGGLDAALSSSNESKALAG